MPESPEGWRLDKRVSVGQILTTAAALVAALVFFLRLEARVDLNAQALAEERSHRVSRDHGLSGRMDRAERRSARMFAEIRDALRRIEDKLDRKMDK